MNTEAPEKNVDEQVDSMLSEEQQKENLRTATRILEKTISKLEKEYNVKLTLVNFGLGFVTQDDSNGNNRDSEPSTADAVDGPRGEPL